MANTGTVAIIGAGMAGLACASICHQAGLSVSVFDKGRGPGGRMSSRRIESPITGDPLLFDHGAQYLTVRDPDFATALQTWIGTGVVQPFSGRLVRQGETAEGLVPVSAAQSDLGGARWVACPGTNALPKAMASALFAEETGRASLRTGVRIDRIRRTESGWVLVADDVVYGPFDRVAVTVPAPQAVDLLDPVAPRMADQARTARMDPCWAAMLGFDRVIEPDIPFEAAFLSEVSRDLMWVARCDGRPGRPSDAAMPGGCWVLHASAEWTRAHLEDRAEHVAPALYDAFRSCLKQGEMPYPAILAAHRWRHARVTQPVAKTVVPGFSEPLPLLWDGALGLGAAGDWTCGERIEDAWVAGARLARVLATDL